MGLCGIECNVRNPYGTNGAKRALKVPLGHVKGLVTGEAHMVFCDGLQSAKHCIGKAPFKNQKKLQGLM